MNPNLSKEGENTQFKPGQSGNPSGRPKSVITQCLREFGESVEIKFAIERTDKDGAVSKQSSRLSTGDQTINQAIAARLLQMAMNGDIKAIREVLNRTEGRVPQPLNIGGQGNNPVKVTVYMPDNGRRKTPDNSVGNIPPAETEESA